MLELSFVAIDFQIIHCCYLYMWLCCGGEELSWYALYLMLCTHLPGAIHVVTF